MVNLKLKKNKEPEKKTEKEKVEERKEEVLARGRKFKYPLQYAKHKLVFDAVIIAVVGVAGMLVLGWAMLYKMQNTGDVIYRITRVLPVKVASVDGEGVKFSDYLMVYRSSIKAVEQQSGTLSSSEEDEAVRNEYKRAALDNVEELTYAYKLSKEMNVIVSKDEIAAVFEEHKNIGGVERNEDTFLKVVKDNFGLNRTEYNRMIELSLYKKKVQEAIDDNANEVASKIEKKLKENGNDMRKIKEEMGDAVQYEATGGLVDSKNIDGGRASRAALMEKGEVAKIVSSNGDGYYFVKLNNKKDGRVEYESLKVEFSVFAQKFAEVQEGIVEYIEL